MNLQCAYDPKTSEEKEYFVSNENGEIFLPLKVAISGIIAGIKLTEEFPNIKEMVNDIDKDTANFLKGCAEKLLIKVVTYEKEFALCSSTEE